MGLMAQGARPGVGPIRRFALSSLRLLTRAGASTPVRLVYKLFPAVVKDRVRVRLMALASARVAVPDSADVQLKAGPAAASRKRGLPSVAPRPDGLGANLVGFVHGALGLAENLRSCARALIDANFPISLVEADILGNDRTVETNIDLPVAVSAPFPVDVFFVNPDQIGPALAATEATRSVGTYRIGYWFWELPRIPPEWVPALDTVDEIWVASNFVGDAFRQVTDKPIMIMPMVVEPMPLAEPVHGRNAPFTFLFSFDFHSYLERKNPRAVLDAFLAAFPSGREPARLIVKTINGNAFRTELLALMSRASEDRRIEILDGYMSRDAMNELVATADSYVSLHRAEGFGLGLAESMALGKPVIATGYSGNLAFMNAENSLLVSYHLVDVEPGQYMHGAGQQWAEPDIQDAAIKMRGLVEDRVFASKLGRRAREYMKERHSSRVSARAIVERLEAISRSGCLESPGHHDGVRQIHE